MFWIRWSRYYSSTEKSVRRKEEQIVEAKKTFLRSGKRNGVVRFDVCIERENAYCFLFEGNAINWSETHAEATNNVSTDFSEKHRSCLHTTRLCMFISCNQTTLFVAVKTIEHKRALRNQPNLLRGV